MAKKPQKKKTAVKPTAVPKPKDFLDMVAPSAVKFNTDCSIIGGAYHTFLTLRGYAASTEELALLSQLGAKDGVNLSLYARQVTAAEEKQIIQNASNKNRLTRSNTNDLQQSVAAESDLQDVAALNEMFRQRSARKMLAQCVAAALAGTGTVRQRCRFSAWYLGHYHREMALEQKYFPRWERISEIG